MAFVYILEGTRYYVGSTANLQRRLKDHGRGQTATTKRIGDWKLVWKKECSSREEAYFLERKIKSWKSSKMIGLLI